MSRVDFQKGYYKRLAKLLEKVHIKAAPAQNGKTDDGDQETETKTSENGDKKPESSSDKEVMLSVYQHIEAETKWPPFSRQYFQVQFIEWNWISMKIWLKFVPKGAINNIHALVQIMAWRWPGDKPLSESMMAKFTDAYIYHWASMS